MALSGPFSPARISISCQRVPAGEPADDRFGEGVVFAFPGDRDNVPARPGPALTYFTAHPARSVLLVPVSSHEARKHDRSRYRPRHPGMRHIAALAYQIQADLATWPDTSPPQAHDTFRGLLCTEPNSPPAVERCVNLGRRIRQEGTYLTIVGLAQPTSLLYFYAAGVLALLRKGTGVEHDYAVRVG